jgi:hypothetical protein
MLGYLNDVWKYEIELSDTEDEIGDTEEDIGNTEDEIGDTEVTNYNALKINLLASNSIHILGKIKGSNIQLTSEDIVIEGTVEISMK